MLKIILVQEQKYFLFWKRILREEEKEGNQQALQIDVWTNHIGLVLSDDVRGQVSNPMWASKLKIGEEREKERVKQKIS